MKLIRYQTAETEMWIREGIDSDKGVCLEVHDNDTYRIKRLYNGGFKPKVIVDIGGHIGTFTAMAALYWPYAHIYVFEPQLKDFRMLAMNLPESAVAVRAAILGYAGQEKAKEMPQMLVEEPAWRANRTAISVRSMLALIDQPIDFLKIDCEGAELSILTEMDELNAVRGIEVIHGEWHQPLGKQAVREILSKTHKLEITNADKPECQCDTFYATRL